MRAPWSTAPPQPSGMFSFFVFLNVNLHFVHVYPTQNICLYPQFQILRNNPGSPNWWTGMGGTVLQCRHLNLTEDPCNVVRESLLDRKKFVRFST